MRDSSRTYPPNAISAPQGDQGGNEAQACELKLRKSDRSEFFAQLISTVELDEGCNFKQLRMTLADITERKKAEEELIEHQTRLKNMS